MDWRTYLEIIGGVIAIILVFYWLNKETWRVRYINSKKFKKLE